MLGVRYIFKLGEVRRGEVQRFAKVAATQGAKIIHRLLGHGLIRSDSAKGALRLKVEPALFRHLCPDFFNESY